MQVRRIRSSPSPRLAARLVTRLYLGADEVRRSRIVCCLLRPLGVLSIAAVAAGAFRPLLGRHGLIHDALSPDIVAHYTRDQILELARFVQDVDPDALMQVTSLIADNPWALSGFSAAVILLLRRALAPTLNLPAAPPRLAVSAPSASTEEHR